MWGRPRAASLGDGAVLLPHLRFPGSRLEGTRESSQRWQSISSVAPLPPGWTVTPPRAEQSGGAAPALGEGRGSRTPPPAAQAPPMSPGGSRAALPCLPFPSFTSSFFHLKMGETSRAAAPGLSSSPSPPPPSPRSARSLSPPLGKGTRDITGVSSLRAGRAARPCFPSAPRCPCPPLAPGLTPLGLTSPSLFSRLGIPDGIRGDLLCVSRELLGATNPATVREARVCCRGAGLLLGTQARPKSAPCGDIHRSGHSLQHPGLSLQLGGL